MTLQAPKRRPRCALTGVPIADGDVVMLVGRGMAKRRRPRYLERADEADTVEPPLTLHRNETEAGGLGGLIYHAMMARYLGHALTAEQAAERLELLAWWHSDYGRNRVRLGLLKRLPEQSVAHVLEVVMTCHREQADPAEIAERFGHSEQWLRGKIDWCMHLAQFHRDACQCVTCQLRSQVRAERRSS